MARAAEAEVERAVGSSRTLLLPGPQPPLSHFGATLLRHVVVTGLRYSLYHLGMPLPVRPPIRIERLRVELDRTALEKLLAGTAGGAAVTAALTDPEGTDAGEQRPIGAAFFHRIRLRWGRRSPLPAPPALQGVSRPGLESGFRDLLTRSLPRLNDAMLTEIVAAMRRRRQRRRRDVPAVHGHEADRFLRGARYRGERLGRLDPLLPSWRDEAPSIDRAVVEPGAPHRDRRGVFRETYREALDRLRPTLRALGDLARDEGIVDHADDLFFLPMELLGDLTLAARPAWLDGAVLRNRAEYFGLEREADEELRARWAAAPLHPLP